MKEDMLKPAIVILIPLLLSACDACKEKSAEFLGAGTVCNHSADHTAVCARPDGARFICVTSESSIEPRVVCIQGLGVQAEK